MTEMELIEHYNQILQLNILPQNRKELFLEHARHFLYTIFNELKNSKRIRDYKTIKANIDSLISEPDVSNLISDYHLQTFFFLSRELGKPNLIDMFNNVAHTPTQTYNIDYQMMNFSQFQYMPYFGIHPLAFNPTVPFMYIPMQYTNHNFLNSASITTGFCGTNQPQLYTGQQQAAFNLGFSSTNSQQATQVAGTHQVESITHTSKITIKELNTKSVSVEHISGRSISEPPIRIEKYEREVKYIESSSYKNEEYITNDSIFIGRPISAPPSLQLAQISYEKNKIVNTLPKIKDSIATHINNAETTDITLSSNSATIAEPNIELLNSEKNNILSNNVVNSVSDNIIKKISVDATKKTSADKSSIETTSLKQSKPKTASTMENITPLFSEIVKESRLSNKSQKKANISSDVESKSSIKELISNTKKNQKKSGISASLDVKDIVKDKNSIAKIELSTEDINNSASNKFDVLFDDMSSDDEVNLTPALSFSTFSHSNNTVNRKKKRKNLRNESTKKTNVIKSNSCNAQTINDHINEMLDNFDYRKYNDLYAKVENKFKLINALIEQVKKNVSPNKKSAIYKFFLLANLTLAECEKLLSQTEQSSTNPFLLALSMRKAILLKELDPENNFLSHEYLKAVGEILNTEALGNDDNSTEDGHNLNKQIAIELSKIFLAFSQEIVEMQPGDDIDISPYIPILNMVYTENKTPLMLGLESNFEIQVIKEILTYTALPTLLQFDNNSMNVIHYSLLNITENTIEIIDLLFKKVIHRANDNRDIFNRFINNSGTNNHIFWDMIINKPGPLTTHELELLKKIIAPQPKDSLTFNAIESIIDSTEPDRPLQKTVYYKILKKFINNENQFCKSVLKKCEYYITAYKNKINNNYQMCKNLKICKFTDILLRINDVDFFQYLHQKSIITIGPNELLASLLFYADFDNGDYSISNYIYKQIKNTPSLPKKNFDTISDKIWESGLKLPCTDLLEWALDNSFIKIKSENIILQTLLDNSTLHKYNHFKVCLEKILKLPKEDLSKLCTNGLNMSVIKSQLKPEQHEEILSLFLAHDFMLDDSRDALRMNLSRIKEVTKAKVKSR